MIWILTTLLILRRCKNPCYRFQQWICPCAVRKKQVALFYLPSVHQISTLGKTNFRQHSTLRSLMSKRLEQVAPFFDAAQSTTSEVIDFQIWCPPGFQMHSRQARSRDQIHHRFRLFTWIFLCSFQHHFRTICGTEMANVKQTQKMIPFITREISLGQYVCELVFGVNVFDLDLLVQIDSLKQPIKSNSVDSGNMSHCMTPSFNDHLDHCFVVFKTHTKKSLDAKTRRLREHNQCYSTRWSSLEIFDLSLISCLTVLSIVWVVFPRTETVRSHKSRAGIPSNLNPASKEMMSDSVNLCETEVCFLHIQPMGTNVRLPNMHKILLKSIFESWRSLAKSESWNNTNLHCCTVFPTWQYCLYSHVWWT